MEFFNPILMQTHAEPIFFHSKKNSYSNRSYDDELSGFEDLLGDALDDAEHLPDDLEEKARQVGRLKVFTEEEIFIISMNFNQHAIQLVHDINQSFSPQSFHVDYLERQLLRTIRTLFILVVQYGSGVALQSLSEIWIHINSYSIINQKVHSYFDFLATKSLPLIPYKEMATHLGNQDADDRQAKLKEFFSDILHHRIPEEKASEIIKKIKA